MEYRVLDIHHSNTPSLHYSNLFTLLLSDLHGLGSSGFTAISNTAGP